MTEHFSKLCNYNTWANNRMVDSFKKDLPGDEIMGKLSHIALAESVWLDRLAGIAGAQRDIFDLLSLSEIEALLGNCQKKWLIEIGDAKDFQKLIAFRRMDGTEMKNSIADIITHTFNHGTYHRAQIATLTRQAGKTPIVTDYIAFSRVA